MKPILFIDFDGTICHDRFWRGLGETDYNRIQKFLIEGNRAMVDEWLRGKHTSEEINLFLSDNLDIPYEKLWEIFVKDIETMDVPVELLEKIHSLRDRYQTVLITVNMDCFDRFTVPALKLDNYFDLIINSYNDGRFKHENGGEVFVEYAQKLKANLKDSYLIDDSENNCTTFANLGGTAYRVSPEENTMSFLKEIEVRV